MSCYIHVLTLQQFWEEDIKCLSLRGVEIRYQDSSVICVPGCDFKPGLFVWSLRFLTGTPKPYLSQVPVMLFSPSQAGFELTLFEDDFELQSHLLSPPHKCWDCRHVPCAGLDGLRVLLFFFEDSTSLCSPDWFQA